MHSLALIVYGAGLSDRLRLIERLAGEIPHGEQLAVVLTSLPLFGASEAAALHLPEGTLVETAAGCPCCIGRVAVQVTLVRLLRRAQPHRLLIEVAGTEHVAGVVAALAEERLAGFVRVAGTFQA